jgi:hypothetical protein
MTVSIAAVTLFCTVTLTVAVPFNGAVTVELIVTEGVSAPVGVGVQESPPGQGTVDRKCPRAS